MSLDKNALAAAIALHDAIALRLRPFMSEDEADDLADDLTKLPELRAALPTTSVSEPVAYLTIHQVDGVKRGFAVVNRPASQMEDGTYPLYAAPSEPVSDLVKRLREAAVEVGKSGNILAATDLVSAASALTAAEARAAEAERSGDALLAAQNEIVNTVWGLLGGQDDTREGGSNLISRVAELVMRAEVAEAKIDELEHRSLAEGWRPIETAPKRGTYLVYQPVHRAGRDALTARVCLNDQAGYVRQSTHWMPIPQPPEAK